MRVLSLLILAASAAALHASDVAAQYPTSSRGYDGWRSSADARVWVEGDRDFYRSGDNLRVRFSVSEDSYVAVLHVDSDGVMEFLYPRSPWDDGFTRGRRTHALPRGSFNGGWRVRGSGGIGYLYIVASPVPLDFRYFAGRGGSVWDYGYTGHRVVGDPFWVFEQVTEMLVPDWRFTPYAVDYFGYHVGGIHRYPAYACNSRYANDPYYFGYRSGWNANYFGSCDRLDFFLREHPHYFDTRRFRGDRRAYIRQLERRVPRYEFKEDPRQPLPRANMPAQRFTPDPRGEARTPLPGTRQVQPQTQQRSREVERQEPTRRRPTLERRRPADTRSGGTPARPSPRPSTRPDDGGGSSRPAARPARPASDNRGGASRSSGGSSSRPTARPSSRSTGQGSSRPATRPSTGSRDDGGSSPSTGRPARND